MQSGRVAPAFFAKPGSTIFNNGAKLSNLLHLSMVTLYYYTMGSALCTGAYACIRRAKYEMGTKPFKGITGNYFKMKAVIFK
jgi:hypothetical protein